MPKDGLFLCSWFAPHLVCVVFYALFLCFPSMACSHVTVWFMPVPPCSCLDLPFVYSLVWPLSVLFRFCFFFFSFVVFPPLGVIFGCPFYCMTLAFTCPPPTRNSSMFCLHLALGLLTAILSVWLPFLQDTVPDQPVPLLTSCPGDVRA